MQVLFSKFRYILKIEKRFDKVSVLASNNKGKILFGAGDNPYILLREKNVKNDKLLDCVNNVLNYLKNEEE